jgi:GT2 family glycosyltransferase
VKFDYPKDTKFEFYIDTVGNVFTALARERLAESALENNMDYLFMIDDDMITDSNFFEQLYRHNVDIVAGLAFTRNPPHSPVIYELNKGYDAVAQSNYYINYSLLSYPKNQLVQCDAVGFGGVLIKVDCLRNIPKPWFMTTSGAGEDIHFCHKAGESGFKIFMDTSAKMGHMGYRPVITEESYESNNNIEELKKVYGDRSRCR